MGETKDGDGAETLNVLSENEEAAGWVTTSTRHEGMVEVRFLTVLSPRLSCYTLEQVELPKSPGTGSLGLSMENQKSF